MCWFVGFGSNSTVVGGGMLSSPVVTVMVAMSSSLLTTGATILASLCFLILSKIKGGNGDSAWYWPYPFMGRNNPWSVTMRPLKITYSGPPVTSRPSNILKSHLERCSSLVIVLLLLGSQITMSASDPTAIHPFLGKILSSLAGTEEDTSTNLDLEIFPVWTPFCQRTRSLSSTPMIPVGIFLKSSLPRAFC